MIIAIEGIDGSGKTTLAEKLAGRVVQGRHIVRGGEMLSPIGELLRERLTELTPLEKVYWFAADRCSVLERLDQSRTEAMDVVIWDRYIDSARSYRAAEAQLGEVESNLLHVLEDVNRAFPPAFVTFYLDVAPETAARRRDVGIDRRWPHVRTFFESRCAEDPAHYVRIDAERSATEVAEAVEGELIARLAEELPIG